MAPTKRESFTLKAKLNIIAQWKVSKVSKRSFAKTVGIEVSTFRSWLKKEPEIQRTCKQLHSRRRLPRPKKGMFPQVDKLVNEWVIEQKMKGNEVKDSFIQKQGLIARDQVLATMEESQEKEALKAFEASKIWCYRFKCRFGFGICTRTQSPSENCKAKSAELNLKLQTGEEVNNECMKEASRAAVRRNTKKILSETSDQFELQQ